MTRHLSVLELAAVIDESAEAAVVEHLRGCEFCRAALAETEAMVRQVKAAAEVPEPSPLFWDRLSERIRRATADASAGRQAPWWQALVQPRAFVGAGVAVVLAAAVWSLRPGVDESAELPPVAESASSGVWDVSWDTVAEMASRLSPEDVQLVVGAAEAPAVAELTAGEREAFVRMLGREMGGLP